ncbi:MAG TPA: NnrU family protein [Burkholderiales bacterium]|nr:NnrU family protein [Burkholderiales bacterium]HYA47871.1 NnrU family protein [Burkholderiales bacterium]
MEPMSMLVLATAVFIATHFVPSTPLRPGLVAALGEKGYLGLYSVVALAAIAWMIWAYMKAPYERLWVGDEFKVWAIVLMPVALVSAVAGGMTRNPSAVRQESALATMGEPRGILRITRHPIQWGIALWALLHVIVRGDTASLVFFGGFALLAVLGTALIDARKNRALGASWQRFASATSNFPFAAIVRGRNQFRFDEIGWTKVLIALVAYFALLFLHPWLFGARPY